MSLDACGVSHPGNAHHTIDSSDCLSPVSCCHSVGAVTESDMQADCGVKEPASTVDQPGERADEVSCMDTMTKLLEVIVAIVTALVPGSAPASQSPANTQTSPTSSNSGQ